MKLFAQFRSEKNKNFDSVELCYSIIMQGGGKWFCRIWHKDWLKKVNSGKLEYGESYGKNKFEAYRKALNNLKQ